MFQSLRGIPGLLQKVINENDAAAWAEITEKIDYIYANLDYSLAGLDQETGFAGEVKRRSGQARNCYSSPTW